MGQHVTLSDLRSPPLSICDLQCAHPELPRFITIVVGVSYARANAHHRDAPFGVTLGQATSALEFQFHFERHRLRWGKAYEMLRDISLLLSLCLWHVSIGKVATEVEKCTRLGRCCWGGGIPFNGFDAKAWHSCASLLSSGHQTVHSCLIEIADGK